MVMAAAGPGALPPSRTTRPSANVTSSVPCLSFEPKPSASRTRRGNSGNVASTVSDVTEINSDMCDPSNVGLPGLRMADRPRSVFGMGGQRGWSIMVATPGRQAGIEGCILPRHQPRALQPEPQRLPVDRRHDLHGDQREAKERA